MPYRLCNRCVMDTTDMDIIFDKNGHCNHCTDALATNLIEDQSPELLEEIISNIKKKGERSKYDCVVGISGGVDSSYTAYLCKNYGLRPLLVHMDNGWNTEISVKNLKNIYEIVMNEINI